MLCNKFHKALYNIKYITKSKKNVNEPIFWIFLDELRLLDYTKFIKLIPENKHNKLGIVFRSVNKKNLFGRYQELARLCNQKKIPFLVSDNPTVAKALGAKGVHFSKNISYSKRSQGLIYSCSFHGLNDLRRLKNLDADLVFISPVFKTNSSDLKKPLGLLITGLLFNYVKTNKAIMGGLNLDNIRLFRGRSISCFGGLEYIYNNFVS